MINIQRRSVTGGKNNIQKFKRTNQLLIEQHRRLLDDWNYLTLEQHLSISTRLLALRPLARFLDGNA